MSTFRSIECLRAWMAWWVVLAHALEFSGAASTGIGLRIPRTLVYLASSGASAVRVFIIVSGFVIAHLILQKREPYAHYLTRRFFRIAPIYVVGIILAIIVTNFYRTAFIDLPFATDRDFRLARLLEQKAHFWTHLMVHATLLHGMIPNNVLPFAATTFLSAAWSLSLEWQFYLIAPALIAVVFYSRLNAVVVAFALLVLRIVLQGQSVVEWSHDAFFFLAADYFMVGILCRLALEQTATGARKFELLIPATFLLLNEDRNAAFIWIVFYGIALYESGIIKIGNASIRKFIGFFALNEKLALLGKWSYSTYLIHLSVFSIFVGIYASIVGVKNVTQMEVVGILIATIPVIAVLSAILYRYIEAPSMQLGRNLISRRLDSLKSPV